MTPQRRNTLRTFGKIILWTFLGFVGFHILALGLVPLGQDGPAKLLFGYDLVVLIIGVCLSPFILAWLFVVMTIGAGVSVGNLGGRR